MTVALVALGAAIGGVARYLTGRAFRMRFDKVFPWGTLTVNVLGSLVFGFLVGTPSGRLDAAALAALGTGFCGALTTYSTFGDETLQLVEGRFRWLATANVVVGLIGTVSAAALGWALACTLGGA